MRVLIIGGGRQSPMNIEKTLTVGGVNNSVSHLWEEGIELAGSYGYKLIILDLDFCGMEGDDALRQLRREGVSAPVLIVSQFVDVPTKVRAFRFGADDFMIWPFEESELLARVGAIVRRSNGVAQSIVIIADISVDLIKKTVDANGIRIHFTSKEYEVMELLVLRQGETVTKRMVLDSLYAGVNEPTEKIVDVMICKIRAKMKKELAGASPIRTVWGQGYTLDDWSGSIGSLASGTTESRRSSR